ncbi:barstar family protein [Flavobacterium ardleyense]|uniref:Barstar family protein n=1 Tax=Flavobacterium ardleyense TaxID=2038737 RepID=A0ABW5Z8P2_9FLAO
MVEIDLNFQDIKNKKSFFNLMSKSFDLPNYFKNSFDSLDECMRDLSWLSGDYLEIKIKNLDPIKITNQELYNDIIESIEFYNQYWINSNDKKVIFSFE